MKREQVPYKHKKKARQGEAPGGPVKSVKWERLKQELRETQEEIENALRQGGPEPTKDS